jgi:hypothetical protein
MKHLFVPVALSVLTLCGSWSQAQSSDRDQEVVAQMNADTKGALLIPFLAFQSVEGESVNLRGDKLVIHTRECLHLDDDLMDPQCEAQERELPLAAVDFESIKPAAPSAKSTVVDEEEFHYVEYSCKRGSSCAGKEPSLACRDAAACKRMAEGLKELVAGFLFAEGFANMLSSLAEKWGKSGERATAPAANIAPPGLFPPFGTKARAVMEQDGTLEVHWGDVFHPDATVFRYPPSHPLYARIKRDVDNLGDREAPRRPIKPGESRGFTPTMTEAK